MYQVCIFGKCSLFRAPEGNTFHMWVKRLEETGSTTRIEHVRTPEHEHVMVRAAVERSAKPRRPVRNHDVTLGVKMSTIVRGGFSSCI